ncbi:MAG: hypothetical protein ACW975_05015 [Candidatus Thorarchaeota archaeon]
MRRVVLILALCIILSSVMITPVAATNQGLEWGVPGDTRLYYNSEWNDYSYYYGHTQEDIYFLLGPVLRSFLQRLTF